MINGALHMIADARDFTFQRGDPRLQFRNRQRIEILFHQDRERVARARQILFGIHMTKR